MPTRSGFDAYDQYRLANGTPRYPQRPVLAGAAISQAVSGGGTHSGAITGKVIAVSSLLDADAFPWHADWYGRQVRSALGAGFEDTFRLWFTDHADHIAPGRTPRLIDYTGIVEQALRDVAAWAEHGRAPAPSTRYTVAGGQVEVAAAAAQRRGLQPKDDVTVDDRQSFTTTVGQPLRLDAEIAVPPGAGSVVDIAWNATGLGPFEPVQFTDSSRVSHTVTYSAPGTYYPAVRVSVQREADRRTPFARIETLGRMRIVVHP
ncbi:hypothetical protein MMAD_55570 (plasmid) [Mycolicibacterium madagascariense]|uniref:PKD domain-containing protein n=1 Tax=Mycolicibacterium madagascariense TaxID=212765 RepID=A0A7I7XQE7_9MYCO|nr:hypothetical protein [Mycolicibacterium madagascariense]BBZ31262.1 hypothetical protein MMAD_55570 [Mycolicibacterium madagascariense]